MLLVLHHELIRTPLPVGLREVVLVSNQHEAILRWRLDRGAFQANHFVRLPHELASLLIMLVESVCISVAHNSLLLFLELLVTREARHVSLELPLMVYWHRLSWGVELNVTFTIVISTT